MIVHFTDKNNKECSFNTKDINELISIEPGKSFTFKKTKYKIIEITHRVCAWDQYEIFIDVSEEDKV